MASAINLPPISVENAQRLSRAFNFSADLRMTEDHLINEWLKSLIAFSGRCSLCHGTGEVNFEQANGWEEPCPRCTETNP